MGREHDLDGFDVTPLTREDEDASVAELAALRADPGREAEYLAARTRFVAASLWVVPWAIRKRRPSEFRTHRIADSLQAGVIGLINAADSVEPNDAAGFPAFAYRAVWWEVGRSIRDDAMIYLPERGKADGEGRYGADRLRALTFGRGTSTPEWTLTEVRGRAVPSPTEEAEAERESVRRFRKAIQLHEAFEAERRAPHRAAVAAHFAALAMRDRLRRVARKSQPRALVAS